MAEDVLSSFFVKIVYDQDERSRKKFDAGLKSIQDNAQEFGKKIEALPAIVHEATKKISQSLTSLYYAAQQTRATEQQLHAFSRGIKDSGGDVDQANASYKAFVEDLNLYGSGLTKSIPDDKGRARLLGCRSRDANRRGIRVKISADVDAASARRGQAAKCDHGGPDQPVGGIRP